MADQATLLVVPQVNVNDDTVLLVRWSVAPDSTVSAGDAVCDVETTKAASEVTAHAGGVLVQSATAGTRVRVGEMIGAIGPSREAAAACIASHAEAARSNAATGATPKATALAEHHGVSLDAVRAGGVRGTIKETDVQRFLSSVTAGLPAGLSAYLEREGPVPAFDAAVAANLRRSTSQLILTTVDMDCELSSARAAIQQSLAAGKMVSLLHLVIAAVARALPGFPRLMSFAHDGSLYRYKAVDVAFVARTSDGRLFTPVMRAANASSVDEIAKAAQAATMRVLRGSAKAEELEGAAFTISQVPVPGTTRVVALPSFGQSAILGVSAERGSIVTFTLNYDHALCDGVYAATFLAAVVKDLEAPRS